MKAPFLLTEYYISKEELKTVKTHIVLQKEWMIVNKPCTKGGLIIIIDSSSLHWIISPSFCSLSYNGVLSPVFLQFYDVMVVQKSST